MPSRLNQKPVESKLPERKLQDSSPNSDKVADSKPDESKVDNKELSDQPLTLEDKLKAAAEKMDAGASKDSASEERSVLEILPPQYAWAKEVVNNGKLAEWVSKQGKTVKSAAASGDVEDSVFVLDLYKKSIEPSQPVHKAAQQELKSFIEEFGHIQVRSGEGKTKALKDLAGEYENSEIFEAMAAVSKAMAERNKAPDTNGDFDSIRKEMEEMKYHQFFWDKVSDAHPEGKKLVNSGSVEKWINEQASPHVKRLFSSSNPDDAILVLDAYKEAKAKETGNGNAAKSKKDIDGLHGNSLRSKRDPQIPKQVEGYMDDFDAGFELASKGQKK